MTNELFARGQHIDYLLMQFLSPLGYQIRRYAAQWVRYPQRLEPLAPKNAGMPVGRIQEWVRTYDYRGDTLILQGHGVVHTARGAGPSIRDAGHHKIALGG